MRTCYKCRKPIEKDGVIGREDLCPWCNTYLRCCLNCQFFDETAHNKCRETQSEWIGDRTKANFCEYFVFSEMERGKERSQQKEVEARKAFEDLFKKI